MLAPWYCWWQMVDKKRLVEISFYGVLSFVAVLGSDATGVAYHWWSYPIRLAPKFPHILPVDTSVLPIAYMLVYQYFPKWTNFIFASTIIAAVLAFIGEPIAASLNIYELDNWTYYYSFPMYVVYGIALKFVAETVKGVQHRASESVKRR